MNRQILTAIGILLVIILTSEVMAQSREIRLLSARGVPGQSVVVPIEMVAIGNENAVGFSLNFDPRLLSNPRLTIGAGLSGVTLNSNLSNALDGRIGIVLALPVNQSLTAGPRQLLTISFDIATAGVAGGTLIAFGDQPVAREVVDAAAIPLSTIFTNGQVQLLPPVTITVAPSDPTSIDEIVVEARGVWNDGCVPTNPIVTRDGASITLTTTSAASVCVQALTPYILTVPIGRVARGSYIVNLVHQASSSTIRLGSTTLQVRGGLVNTNATSYRDDSLAPDSIVAAFGADLATSTTAAPSLPLPVNLAGTTVRIKDANGFEHLAPIFFVSPLQVNYHLPVTVATGRALVTITSGNGLVSSGSVMIGRIAPGLFTLDGSGKGLVAAYIQRNTASGQVLYEQVWRLDTGGAIVTQSIDLGAQTDQLFLVLYGTGFRSRTSLGAVTVRIGGLPAEVLFAGGVQDYIGLDQCNVRLDRQLIGRGVVEIEMIVDGQSANRVNIAIK
jgi:uncharacterized protein (TIGR03437 family)